MDMLRICSYECQTVCAQCLTLFAKFTAPSGTVQKTKCTWVRRVSPHHNISLHKFVCYARVEIMELLKPTDVLCQASVTNCGTVCRS